MLWSLAIDLEPKANRKKKIKDALNYCENDPYVHASVAKIFWSEKKNEKVRKWLEKALLLDDNIGDHWALLYLFELDVKEGEDKMKDVLDKCVLK